MPPKTTLPENKEAEEAILGSLMIGPDALIEIAPTLTADDFYREKNGWVYKALVDLHERNEPVDLVTIVDELTRTGMLPKVGGVAHIMQLVNSVPTSVHAAHYAHIVRRDAVLRRLIAKAQEIASIGYGDWDDEADAIAAAEGVILNLANDFVPSQVTPMGDHIGPILNAIEAQSKMPAGTLPGLSTGYAHLDNILKGIKPSELIILAAPPSEGKSAFMLNMALNMGKAGKKVAIFSCEMDVPSLTMRALSVVTGIAHDRLITGAVATTDDWEVLFDGASRLADWDVHLAYTPGLSITQLRTECRRLQLMGGLDIIFVDYLTLMSTPEEKFESDTARVTWLSKKLKELNGELGVPIVCLSQLNRSRAARSDKRPVMTDLRQSGAIEQDADVIILLYREGMHDNVSIATGKQSATEVIIAKHRNGMIGMVPMYFEPKTTGFFSLAANP
jgi:replicative DNA helicase